MTKRVTMRATGAGASIFQDPSNDQFLQKEFQRDQPKYKYGVITKIDTSSINKVKAISFKTFTIKVRKEKDPRETEDLISHVFYEDGHVFDEPVKGTWAIIRREETGSSGIATMWKVVNIKTPDKDKGEGYIPTEEDWKGIKRKEIQEEEKMKEEIGFFNYDALFKFMGC